MKFDENGLIPIITQDYETKEVLILSYMNKEAYDKTIESGDLYYYSRSRQELWKKGESSGNTQILKSLSFDCDSDALLAQVVQKGPACHTGERSCFYNDVIETSERNILFDLEKTIEERRVNPVEGSYTNYLLDKGIDKILKKIGEESAEMIIAAKNPQNDELIYETSDFLYHMLVLLKEKKISLSDIFSELRKRHR
jgi:phosphoribosyl-ATP pyrophosphohydrolase/phosphoribosyl-AMP cyclohydrolase